eukprot:UN09988
MLVNSLKKHPRLHWLDLGRSRDKTPLGCEHNEITERVCEVLGEYMEKSTALEYLMLRGVNLQDKHAGILIKALENSIQVKNIDLSLNRCSKEIIRKLNSMLPMNRSHPLTATDHDLRP